MREKEFRGKVINQYAEEWFYGDLIQDKEGKMYIITDDYTPDGDGKIELNTCNSPEVVPETVGQYTGIKDKNDKKIYEGDIVKTKHNNCIYVGKIQYNKEYCEYRIELVNAYINLWKKLGLEVIGNIHDNPELLEE